MWFIGHKYGMLWIPDLLIHTRSFSSKTCNFSWMQVLRFQLTTLTNIVDIHYLCQLSSLFIVVFKHKWFGRTIQKLINELNNSPPKHEDKRIYRNNDVIFNCKWSVIQNYIKEAFVTSYNSYLLKPELAKALKLAKTLIIHVIC